VPVVIGGEVGRAVQRLRAFGDEPHVIKDRHQVDVGERVLIIDEIAGPGDGPVENRDLVMQRRDYRFDRLPIGLAVGGLRRGIGEEIGADQGAIHKRVDERNPLLDERGGEGFGWKQGRAGKAAVEIGGDGLGFEQLDVAVAQDRHLAERMNGEDLRPAEQNFREYVVDPFLLANHSYDAGVRRSCAPDHFRFQHRLPPCRSVKLLIINALPRLTSPATSRRTCR
jgi:hypothetical protein